VVGHNNKRKYVNKEVQMGGFIKTYGAFILAFYACLQYWLVPLIKRFLYRGNIDIYETGDIEITYGPIGPAIKLQGTLRASNKSMFIKSMDLLLTRKRDDSKHVFTWFAFMAPGVYRASDQTIPSETPYSFSVSNDTAHRFNIAFIDHTLFVEIRPLFNKHVSEWYKVIKKLNKTLPISEPKEPTPETIKLIKKFRKSKVQTKIFTALDRKCYWDLGDYALTLNVRASKPNRIFSKTFHFSITDSDSEYVKLNVITILEEPISRYLQKQNYSYNYIHAIYQQANKEMA